MTSQSANTLPWKHTFNVKGMEGWHRSPFPTDYNYLSWGPADTEGHFFGPWFPQVVSANFTANSALA